MMIGKIQLHQYFSCFYILALYAVQQSSFKVGDRAAVFGAGPIGLLIIEALRAAGASEVFVSEVSEERKKKASEFGATVLDPKEVDVVEEIHKRTNGGVDVSYEVSGIDPVLTQSINSAKVGGEAMIVSMELLDIVISFQQSLA